MKTNLDWNKFKLFYHVAKTGSFTLASERLNIGQPSLSRSIQSLEYQMKTKLFERVARGIVLTKQGMKLLQATEIAFEEFTRAEMLMLDEERETRGTLTVATTMNLAPGWLMSHIGDFLRKYPEIQLTLIADDHELDLKTRQADVSIRPLIENRPGLTNEIIYNFNLKLYASQDYLNKFGTPRKPKDLDNHKLIVFGFNAPPPYPNINWPLKLGRSPGSLRSPYLCINCAVGMLLTAVEGHGIVSLPSGYPDIAKANLIEVLPQIEKPTIPIYYTYPNHLKDTKKVKVFGNYLNEKYMALSNSPDSPPLKLLSYK